MPNRAATIELLTREIGRALSVLEERLAPDQVLAFFASLGVRFPPELLDQTAFTDAASLCASSASAVPLRIADLFAAIEEGDDAQTLIQGARLIEQIGTVLGAVEEVARQLRLMSDSLPGMTPEAVDAFASTLRARVLDVLLVEYLEARLANPTDLLALFGIIERSSEPGDPADPTKPAFVSKRLRLSRIVDAVRSPVDLLRSRYGWGDPAFDTEVLLAQLAEYLNRSGLEAELHAASPGTPLTLESRIFAVRHNAASNPPGVDVLSLIDLLDGLDLTLPLLVPGWRLELAVRGRFESGLEVSIVPPAQLTLSPPSPPLEGELLIRIVGEPPDPQQPFLLLAQTGTSRLEASSLRFTFGLRAVAGPAGASNGDLMVQAEIVGAKAVMDSSEGDGFLTELTSGLELQSDFDLRCSWSMERGLTFDGSSGLEIRIPQHLSLGPLEVRQVYLASRPAAGRGVPLEISAELRTNLGPLKIDVDRVGFEALLSFPETDGGLPVDFSLGFKPPAGLGLSIDGGGFKGGGFLRFEPELEQYSGMLELEFQDQLTLKALGLLSTRLPNGQSGFSLLLVISSEFTPIQLGFGFKLNGVGGLLGLNRTVKIDRLVSGLRDNTLNSILFPTDVIANADRILSDLRQVFPPERGRFVFGPMAKITWGTPALLTADLGLIIEVPEPVRVAILGVVRAVVPSEQATILRLQVNFLGVIDFEKEHFSFDASLFDSKLLAFTLTGDMAVRLYWGADANFLLTVGGFHPAYQPPPMNLPALRRLTLALLDGDNPRLTLETYVAVTSNTVQLGARLELYAAAWKFNAYGFLSFDALFQLNPFYFVAEVTAMLALRVGTSSIAAIKLTLTLEGPTPWKAKGDARLRLCWFLTVKIRFNKTFGEARNTTLPDLAVLPLLVEALSARDNWEAELPNQRHRLESVRELQAAPDQLVVHPVGTLKISQKVVPLNIQIDRLGSQRPADTRMFGIGEVQVGPDPINPSAAQESFAPAQLFDLSDQEKLASPSFKSFDSGIRVGDPDRLHAAYAAAREVKYELKYIDSQRDRRPARPGGLFTVDPGAFNTWTLQGATAHSDLSFARRRKSHLAPDEVGVVQESFVIVSTGDLKPFDAASVLGSEQAALKRRDALIASNPALRGALQVVPAFEVIT